MNSRVTSEPPAHIRIRVNGDIATFAVPFVIADVILYLGVQGRYAVEVNGDIVPRGVHATHLLADGDRVEVVHAIGGG